MTTVVTNPSSTAASGGVVITDEQLRRMSVAERRALARRLARLTGGGPTPFQRRMFVLAVGAACAALAGWMFELAQTLPARYLVGHWDAAWIGFDSMLLVGLAAVGWTGWRGLEVFSALALATAVLLVCDAWFDVMTTTGGADTVVSILSAVLVELPLAASLTYLAYRRRT
ncbi:hypothetical protein HC031_12325 [Planosporangium thailandense]|uniref:Uncharacterized protein n=1 Tax=Planosporangium thailandense TaxID=765197 RepID=A0ABX0XWT2_9ACTN|nr:hypothetical protein [Planosporangium thailandense]NJC70491.1 hypothetical protein [Planosporangium thailandense]